MTDPVTQYQSDHDLLVTLNERVKNLADHVASVVVSNETLISDHEKRIRATEKSIEAMISSTNTWRLVLTTIISILGLAVAALTVFHRY